jgi:hypothetical protein
MEQLSPLTLKSRAEAYAQADMRGALEPLQPADDLSLEELKCEADSMMSLASWLITRGLGQSEAHHEVFARRLRSSVTEDRNILETLRLGEDEFVKAVLINNFRDLAKSGHSTGLLDRLEHYRQAYYERSPQADGLESHYASSESMLTTGISTATERFAILLYSFNIAAAKASLGKQQKTELAYESDHLPILLAKISVADESRFVDLVNEHDFITTALVRINTEENGPRATFDRRILTKMRQLYPDEKPEYAHRGHLGCPASVSFDGHNSAITELWQMTVGALDKLGFWDSSNADILGKFVAGPDSQ